MYAMHLQTTLFYDKYFLYNFSIKINQNKMDEITEKYINKFFIHKNRSLWMWKKGMGCRKTGLFCNIFISIWRHTIRLNCWLLLLTKKMFLCFCCFCSVFVLLILIFSITHRIWWQIYFIFLLSKHGWGFFVNGIVRNMIHI